MKIIVHLGLLLAIAQFGTAVTFYTSSLYPDPSPAPADVVLNVEARSNSFKRTATYKRASYAPMEHYSRERRAVENPATKIEEQTIPGLTRDARDLLISDRYGYSSYPYSSYSYGLGLGSRYVSDYSYPRYTYSGLRDYSGLSSSLYYV